MGIDNVIKLALGIVMAAALTGQLPRLTNEIRIAQVKLLHESRASNWGSPDLLYQHKAHHKESSKLVHTSSTIGD